MTCSASLSRALSTTVSASRLLNRSFCTIFPLPLSSGPCPTQCIHLTFCHHFRSLPATFYHSSYSYRSPAFYYAPHSLSARHVTSSHVLPFVIPCSFIYCSCYSLRVPHFLLSVCHSIFVSRIFSSVS